MSTEFTQEYINLLVKQYFEKPNAVGEIDLMATGFEKVRDLYQSIIDQYDVDIAVGDLLDKIGKIVGLNRATEFSSDDDYRFFIKLKIAKNAAAAFMVTNTGNSLQDVITIAFSGLAYVIDNKDMSLNLMVDSSVPIETIQLLFDFNLIPKPQGVRYKNVISIEIDGETFGFNNNPNAKGFASKFDVLFIGGKLATKIGI